MSEDDAIETPESEDMNACPDWLLRLLVNMVTTAEGLTIPITLHMGGLIVSGQLVSGKLYLEEFGGQFANEFLCPLPADQRAKLLARIRDTASRIYDQGKETRRVPTYIHLRDATFMTVTGQTAQTNRSLWWRGRLSRVDGFWFGVISTPSTQSGR